MYTFYGNTEFPKYIALVNIMGHKAKIPLLARKTDLKVEQFLIQSLKHNPVFVTMDQNQVRNAMTRGYNSA